MIRPALQQKKADETAQDAVPSAAIARVGPRKRSRAQDIVEDDHSAVAAAKRTRTNDDDDSEHKQKQQQPMTNQNQENANGSPLSSILPQDVIASLTAYNVCTMSILTSAKMTQKISAALTRLSQADSKPTILALAAKGPALGKLVSIVEIIKKQARAANETCWQYTALGGVIVPYQARKAKPKDNAASSNPNNNVNEDNLASAQICTTADPNDSESEDQDAFETMASLEPGSHTAERPKVRRIPTLTIFLCKKPVAQLRNLYGYVTWALISILTVFLTMTFVLTVSREQSNERPSKTAHG